MRARRRASAGLAWCAQGNRIDATSAEGIKLKYKARKEREAAAVRTRRGARMCGRPGHVSPITRQGRLREEAAREAERRAYVQSLAAAGSGGRGGGGVGEPA